MSTTDRVRRYRDRLRAGQALLPRLVFDESLVTQLEREGWLPRADYHSPELVGVAILKKSVTAFQRPSTDTVAST